VIVPTSSVAAVRLRGSIEVAYEDQMSAPDLVPGRCGLRAGIATAGARCFGLRGAFGNVELRRLADADDEQEAVQRRGRQAIARPRSRSRRVPNRATRRNELKRVARADAEYRADMQAGVTLGLVWHPLIARRRAAVLKGDTPLLAEPRSATSLHTAHKFADGQRRQLRGLGDHA
jgi:hypothetical protein